MGLNLIKEKRRNLRTPDTALHTQRVAGAPPPHGTYRLIHTQYRGGSLAQLGGTDESLPSSSNEEDNYSHETD